MRKPLIYENRHDTNDLRNIYNPDKYQHSLGMYVQTNDEKDPKQVLAEKKQTTLDDDDEDKAELCDNPNDPDYDPTLCDDSSDSDSEDDEEEAAGTAAGSFVSSKKPKQKTADAKPQTIEITITTGGDSYQAPTIEIKNDANNEIVDAKVVDKQAEIKNAEKKQELQKVIEAKEKDLKVLQEQKPAQLDKNKDVKKS